MKTLNKSKSINLAMNINLFLGKKTDAKYASMMRRTFAMAIDIFIAAFIRIVTIQICATFWINYKIVEFQTDFKNYFGTETVKNVASHRDFMIHHPLASHMTLFAAIVFFSGALYYIYLHSSSWQATIGKRILGISLVKTTDDSRVTFWRALAQYLTSITPMVFLGYIFAIQTRDSISLMEAISSSTVTTILGIGFLVWIQAHLFTKNRNTAYDAICGTSVINQKTSAKFPWS